MRRCNLRGLNRFYWLKCSAKAGHLGLMILPGLYPGLHNTNASSRCADAICANLTGTSVTSFNTCASTILTLAPILLLAQVFRESGPLRTYNFTKE